MISSFRIRIGRITFNTVNHYKVKVEVKQAHQLKKMLEKIKSKQKSPKYSPKLLEKGSLFSPYQNELVSKRVTNLNKVYMEQITLMVHSGEYGRQFEDLGIEITKVCVASGLNYLNIYWMASKQDIPEHVLNETLTRALAELQEKMGTIRYTDKTPFLKFVRDLRLEREIKLDQIFESADFGRDFEPAYAKKVLTQDFTLTPSDMPEMRQNIFGLDHAKIKGRILAEILKFKAINTAPSKQEEEEEEERQVTHKLVSFNKSDFYKFYKRRRILALKMRKKQKQEGGNIGYEYVDTDEDVQEGEDEDLKMCELEEENECKDERPFKT